MNEGGVLRHCNHCSDSCRATKILSGNPPITHTNSAGTAKWDDFKCPACAECELIAEGVYHTLAPIIEALEELQSDASVNFTLSLGGTK